MNVMGNGNNTNSSSIRAMKQSKSFRKLRWKNYLNHLLNLWLYCGNVSVDGRNHGENGKAAVNLYNKSVSASTSEITFTTPFSVRSFKPLSELNASGHEYNFKTSDFSKPNHTGSFHMSSDNSDVAYSDPNINAINRNSLSENFLDLVKSKPVKRDSFEKSIDHTIRSDYSGVTTAHKGPPRIINPENIVNTTRITNESEPVRYMQRVKKLKSSVTNITSEGETKISIHSNQSSYRNSQPPKNIGDKSARKKLKSVTKSPNNVTAKSVSSRGMKKLSKVSLLGLFEMTTHLGTRWEGKSELAAAELAVKHINERGLLPGYMLELITNDTQVIK